METLTIEQEDVGADANYRLIATAAAFAGTFSFAVVFSLAPSSTNEIMRSFHATKSMLGALFFAVSGAFVITVIAGGWLSDRKGKLPVMMAGCLLMAVGTSIFGLTSSFGMAFISMLLIGLGGGMTEGIAIAAVSDLYGGARRTALLNWTQTLFGVGAIATPVAVARLISTGASWRLAYAGATVVLILTSALAAVAISKRRERPLIPDGHSLEWRELLRDPLVIWLAVGVGLYVGAESGQGNWLAVYFEKGLHSSAAFAASTVAFFWGGVTVGRMMAVWLSKHLSDHSLILWSLGLCTVFETLFLLMPSAIPAIVMVVVIGIAMGPVWPTVLSRAAAAHPGQSGSVFGIIIAMGSAALAIISPIIGAIGDAVGIRPALWLCLALLVANLALFARLGEQRRQR